METTTENTEEPKRHGCGRRRGGIFVLVLTALVAGATGGYIGKSFAQGHPFGGRMMSGDPAKMDAHVERMVKHFAVEVDATPAQKEKLTAIAKDAARDLAPMRVKLQSARKDAIGLVGAATVDRAAMERLRAEHLALAETASRRVSQALADAADVLTPEQRQKVATHLQKRAERFQRWSQG
jgi:protein CpxP